MRTKLMFILITLAVMFMPNLNSRGCIKSEKFDLFSFVFEGFIYKLLTTRKFKDWSHQQKWIGALLVGLVLFNDPTFRIQTYLWGMPRNILGILAIVFKQGFLSLMMGFWLCILDETSSPPDDSVAKSLRSRHFKKYVFCISLWLFMAITYIFVRQQSDADPSYQAATEDSRYVAGALVTIIFLVTYIAWFMFYTCKAAKAISELPTAFKLIFGLTLVAFLAALFAIYAGATYPIPQGAPHFVAVSAIFNLYIWTMAFVYAPLGGSGTESGDVDFNSNNGDNNERSIVGDVDDVQL